MEGRSQDSFVLAAEIGLLKPRRRLLFEWTRRVGYNLFRRTSDQSLDVQWARQRRDDCWRPRSEEPVKSSEVARSRSRSRSPARDTKRSPSRKYRSRSRSRSRSRDRRERRSRPSHRSRSPHSKTSRHHRHYSYHRDSVAYR